MKKIIEIKEEKLSNLDIIAYNGKEWKATDKEVFLGELKNKDVILENKIKELKNEISDLKNQIAELKQDVSSLATILKGVIK